jgi:hypothetical protein
MGGSMVLLFLIMATNGNLSQETAVTAVRDGHLSFNSGRTLGRTFEINPWFEVATWESLQEDQQRVVRVTLPLKDEEALEEYMTENQYSFRKNFKAMQLQHVYGLISEREGVKLRFVFQVHDDGAFDTIGGDILVLHQKDQQWHEHKLSNKAIVEILRGIYARENPFESFIRGLPFK